MTAEYLSTDSAPKTERHSQLFGIGRRAMRCITHDRYRHAPIATSYEFHRIWTKSRASLHKEIIKIP
jgi:hypothetical protein